MKKVALVLLVLFIVCSSVFAQSEAEKFPSKAITLIVPTGAGGGSDTVARKIAAMTEGKLGVPINVVNVVGPDVVCNCADGCLGALVSCV